MMKASTKFGLIMLFIGIAIGIAITWALGPFGDARAHVLEGYTTAVNLKGTAIGLSLSEKSDEAWKGRYHGCYMAGAWRSLELG